MIFVLAFFVLALLMAGMAIGVIMGKQPLKGSCGGVGKALGEKDYVCDLCGGDEQKCEELKASAHQSTMFGAGEKSSIDKQAVADLAYNAASSSKK